MDDVKTAKITIARTAYYTVGVRLWFVIEAEDSTRYQRWSFNMDSTDECLMLIQPKDVVNISYVEQTAAPKKNVLVSVEFA